MFRTRILCLLTALCCLPLLGAAVSAREVDCDGTYCFSAEDFGSGEKTLTGICITGLPDADAGTALLGARVVKPGDILTAGQACAMTFVPVRTETDRDAVMTYLPIYGNTVGAAAEMTLSIRGKEDKAPVAENSTAETYKNLPNEGKLKASDPEGQPLVYTLTRPPKRGDVTLREDGTFLYTPKKNKVGVDSFTYTATDPAGNVSREATVTITILKPTDAAQYGDTAGKSCRFAAEWMKNTGIFTGEQVGGAACFQPDKAVTRGEFLVMVTRALDLPMADETAETLSAEDAPQWLKPYLAAALRSGLTAGLPSRETFGADESITGAEAARMLQNVLDLTEAAPEAAETAARPEQTKHDGLETGETDTAPVWAESALRTLAENGMTLSANGPLTRGQAAETLYQASLLAPTAPGMAVFRTNSGEF